MKPTPKVFARRLALLRNKLSMFATTPAVPYLLLVRSMARPVVYLLLLTLLSGCSPGLVLNLYNATGNILTVTNPPFRHAVTIPQNTSADVSIGTDVLVHSSHHVWHYSQRLLIPPQDFFQKHTMLYRLFGKIDRRGEIYLFAPPRDRATPQPTTQPRGFPVKPQKVHQSMKPTPRVLTYSLPLISTCRFAHLCRSRPCGSIREQAGPFAKQRQ
jgi:hypothetical protein